MVYQRVGIQLHHYHQLLSAQLPMKLISSCVQTFHVPATMPVPHHSFCHLASQVILVEFSSITSSCDTSIHTLTMPKEVQTWDRKGHWMYSSTMSEDVAHGLGHIRG